MPDTQRYLAVVSVTPNLRSESVSTLPTISIRTNIGIDTSQVASDEEFNKYVTLFRLDTDEAVQLTSVAWDATNKVITCVPDTPLASGKSYQFIVQRTLRSAEGRSMVGDRENTFTVDALDIGDPVPLAPGDNTAFSSPPTLMFAGSEGVTGIVSYDVELSKSFKFTPVIWTTTVGATGAGGTFSVAIGEALDADTAYHWHIRVRTDTVTGSWSEVRSFYLGTTAHASQESVLSYQPEALFSLVTLVPEDETTHQTSWPVISAIFTTPPASGSVDSNTFTLFSTSVTGASGGALTRVDAEVTQSGNTITLTPSGTILPNTRYVVTLKGGPNGITSEDGETLPSDIKQTFSGKWTPLYGGITGIRARMGMASASFSDDDLLYYLWIASLNANETAITSYRTVWANDVTQEDLIKFTIPVETWGVGKYCELSAAVMALENHQFTVSQDAGKRGAVGAQEYEVNVKLLDELGKMIKQLKIDRDILGAQWLGKVVMPRMGVRSQYWNEDSYLARDWSVERTSRERF